MLTLRAFTLETPCGKETSFGLVCVFRGFYATVPQPFNKNVLSSVRTQAAVLALGTQRGSTLTGKADESGTERPPGRGRNTCEAQAVPGTAASEQGDKQRGRGGGIGKEETATRLLCLTHTETTQT